MHRTLLPLLLTLAACDDAAQEVIVDVQVDVPAEAFDEVAGYPAAVIAGLGIRQGADTFEGGFRILGVVCEAPGQDLTLQADLTSAWGPCNASDVDVRVFLAPLHSDDCDVELSEAFWTSEEVAEQVVEVARTPDSCGTWFHEARVSL